MTYEQVKLIRQNPTAEDVDNEELARLIDEAIEKQIEQEPILDHDCNYYCAAYGGFVGWTNDFTKWISSYCLKCGQKQKR